MSVSADCSTLAFWGDDLVRFREFPFSHTAQTPANGSVAAIAVELTPGNVTLAWETYGAPSVANGDLPPVGYPAQPSASALQSAVEWWPLGFHHYGGVAWSRNFGFVASGIVGISPAGEVLRANYCYNYIPEVILNGTPKWRFLGYSSINRASGGNPYYLNANAFYNLLGYDLKRRANIVSVEFDTNLQNLQVYETSNAIPTVRGALIWSGTSADRTAGRKFGTSAGQRRTQLPWLGMWWINQYSDSANAFDQVWGFMPGTNGGFSVQVPAAIHAMAQNSGGNLVFAADHMNQRIIAIQADLSATPIDGNLRWPALMYEVTPGTLSGGVLSTTWTPLSFDNTLYIANPKLLGSGPKVNLAPFHYIGGSRFVYFDQRTNNASDYGADVAGHAGTKTGGFRVREIFIPKASIPRTITWNSHTFTGSAIAGGNRFNNLKHIELTFNSSDGKIYGFGGDHGWGDFLDSTLGQGSYNNQVVRFTPGLGNDVELVEFSCPASGAVNHPISVDENGFQYRAVSNDFWMMTGYPDANWTNRCGWATEAAWVAAGGGNDGFHRYSLSGGWTHPGRTKVGIETVLPEAGMGMDARVWTQGHSHCRRWYYDSGADVMIAAAFGYGTDTGLQAPSVQILNCTPSGGIYRFRKYQASSCWNGQGGNTALTPDGRPVNDTVLGSSAIWSSDRAALDPATGHIYVANFISGDVYRIHTRSNFFTHPSSGLPAARVEWVCRMISSPTVNRMHMIWANNALWVFFQAQLGRLRVFSWAEGETAPTEHPTPTGAVGLAMTRCFVGGDERICIIGNEAGSSWGTTFLGNLNTYYTLGLT